MAPYSPWRQCAKCALSVIVFLIGTEVVYKCVRYFRAFLHSGNKSSADETVYYRVLFFPDQGILASIVRSKRSLLADLPPGGGSSNPLQTVRLGITPQEDDGTPQGNDEDEERVTNERSSSPAYDPLPESTSLIHMINVLDAAERSLRICVYLISSCDLIDAIVRAKDRGVRVRVILDKSMSQLSNLSALLKNSVPVRYSKPSQMMHNKFAVADAPENSNRSPCTSPAREKMKNYSPSKGDEDSSSKDEESPYAVPGPKAKRAVLMTGSFNWTWSGVVSNYENVIVTNDPQLVRVYAGEFERLWGLFSFAEAVN